MHSDIQYTEYSIVNRGGHTRFFHTILVVRWKRKSKYKLWNGERSEFLRFQNIFGVFSHWHVKNPPSPLQKRGGIHSLAGKISESVMWVT